MKKSSIAKTIPCPPLKNFKAIGYVNPTFVTKLRSQSRGTAVAIIESFVKRIAASPVGLTMHS